MNIEKELSALSSLTAVKPEIVSLAKQRFVPFVSQANDLIKSLNDSFRIMTALLQDTSSLFGESIKLTQLAEDGSDSSQKFFQLIAQITSVYRKTDEEMKQWLIEESKTLPLKSQPSMESPVVDTHEELTEKLLEEQRKKDTDENLFGRFRNQQEASADDMISQLKAKMKLKKLRTD